MPRTKSIAQIKSNLLRPATTSHFELELGLPTDLRRQLGTREERLLLMCAEATLPGSQLATTEINNDFTGVTERHAYRRMFDDRIDLSFYVDAENYIPIRFFESWISFITNENSRDALNENYFYRMRYPDTYTSTGLKVKKFEKDIRTTRKVGNRHFELPNRDAAKLEYQFVRSWPRSITSMPVTYDSSSLLKCSVQMTYMRYVVTPSNGSGGVGVFNPFQQSQFNSGGFLANTAANLVDSAIRDATGNDFAGDIAGNLAGTLVGRAFRSF